MDLHVVGGDGCGGVEHGARRGIEALQLALGLEILRAGPGHGVDRAIGPDAPAGELAAAAGRDAPVLNDRGAGVGEGVEEVAVDVEVLRVVEVDAAVGADEEAVVQEAAGQERAAVEGRAGRRVDLADADAVAGVEVRGVDGVALDDDARGVADLLDARRAPDEVARLGVDALDPAPRAEDDVAIGGEDGRGGRTSQDLIARRKRARPARGVPENGTGRGIKTVQRSIDAPAVAGAAGVEAAVLDTRDPRRPVAGLKGEIGGPERRAGVEVERVDRRVVRRRVVLRKVRLSNKEDPSPLHDGVPGDPAEGAILPEEVRLTHAVGTDDIDKAVAAAIAAEVGPVLDLCPGSRRGRQQRGAAEEEARPETP